MADERFPEAIAKYAGAMASHFKGLVNHYSPHNEPQLTCLFCGLTGRWPPYEKSVESWAKIGVAVAKGMDLEMQAIRAAIPDSIIISIDPWMTFVMDSFLSIPKDDPNREEIALRPHPATRLRSRKDRAWAPHGLLSRSGSECARR
ncbi:MAG: hypothetical protein U0V70_03685 [Terriglobia bacterium]